MTQPQEPTMLWSDAQIRKVIFDAWKLHFCTYHQDWLVDIVKTVRDDEVTNALAAANAEVERLREIVECTTEELAERQASFDLRWDADMRAIAMWQEATGKELMWPNHADLCVWLMERVDELQRLKAQQWQPLPDGEYEGQHKDHSVIVEGGWLTIREPDWDTPGEFLDTSIALYDNVRLCRLVSKKENDDD